MRIFLKILCKCFSKFYINVSKNSMQMFLKIQSKCFLKFYAIFSQNSVQIVFSILCKLFSQFLVKYSQNSVQIVNILGDLFLYGWTYSVGVTVTWRVYMHVHDIARSAARTLRLVRKCQETYHWNSTDVFCLSVGHYKCTEKHVPHPLLCMRSMQPVDRHWQLPCRGWQSVLWER